MVNSIFPLFFIKRTSVTLSWGIPTTNGGSRILCYIVESSVEGLDAWKKCSVCVGPLRNTKATVTSLRPELCYVFRIAAQNEVGVGPFALVPGSVRPKDVMEEPVVTVDDIMLKDIEMKAGQPLRLSALVKGRPEPRIKWSKEVRDKLFIISVTALNLCISVFSANILKLYTLTNIIHIIKYSYGGVFFQ